MRYIIGIDLGTTNCSVAYVDCEQINSPILNFRLPQLTAPGYVSQAAMLPSCCYLAVPGEWPEGSLDLPWKSSSDLFVGVMALNEGARVPTRVVQSAKSWLCHASVNRQDPILPFEAPSSERKISPVEAAKQYLLHIKAAWNHQIGKGNPELEFEQQEIVLTVPASFDEVARTLTAEAAKLARLSHITLLEEPQAAFYAWLADHESNWQTLLPAGCSVLVCDVGGGTTDFSLLEVTDAQGTPQIQRMAVGDHLLLGGDNMDSAIAHYLEKQLFTHEATPVEWSQLKAQARCAKEALLAKDNRKKQYPIVLQGKGSTVIAGSRTTNISREEIEKMLLAGFFPQTSWQEATSVKKKSGIRTVGLPYEEEPAITKHVAAFLQQSQRGDKPKPPDFVLFNGGTMLPDIFQRSILGVLQQWFEKEPQILSSSHFDLAVSRGAAYYGKVRRGMGVRISGGTARSYYLALGVESAEGEHSLKALTLLPRQSEEGATYEPAQTFWLKPNTAVQFQLYSSHVRLYDQSGDLIDISEEELHPLPPIHSLLRYGKKSTTSEPAQAIPVHLSVHLNAIGTLEVSLKSQTTPHRWQLEFQLRTAAGQENSLAALSRGRSDETLDETDLQKASSCVAQMFARESPFKPAQVMETLEKELGSSRREWSPSILRALWKPLGLAEKNRKRSPEWEARWWNLAGFCLRPGFGFPMDDFRLKELWRIILADLKNKVSGDLELQKYICYRRIAAGLTKGQQQQIAHEILPTVLSKNGDLLDSKDRSGKLYAYTEKIRTLAALEYLESKIKEKFGQALVDMICKGEALPAEYWALSRIGARHLFHAPPNYVIDSAICARWIERILHAKAAMSPERLFVIEQLARKSDCREINLPKTCIDHILEHFSEHPEYEKTKQLLTEVSAMSAAEQDLIFGEHLPTGLSLQL